MRITQPAGGREGWMDGCSTQHAQLRVGPFAQVLVAKFGADAAEDLAHNRRKTLAEFT